MSNKKFQEVIERAPEERFEEQRTFYLGTKEPVTNDLVHFYDSQTDEFKIDKIPYSPAVYKIFDEAISNAVDAVVKNKAGTIEIDIDKKNLYFSIKNKTEHPFMETFDKVDLAFSKFNTTGNYETKKTKGSSAGVAGQNGVGIKAANFSSSEFRVEVANGKELYTVDFNYLKKVTGGMYRYDEDDEKPEAPSFVLVKTSSSISESKSDPYVCVRFRINNDIYSEKLVRETLPVIERRIYDASIYLKDSKIFYNGKRVKVDIKKYICAESEPLVVKGEDGDPFYIYNRDKKQFSFALVNGVHLTNMPEVKKDFHKALFDHLFVPTADKKHKTRDLTSVFTLCTKKSVRFTDFSKTKISQENEGSSKFKFTVPFTSELVEYVKKSEDYKKALASLNSKKNIPVISVNTIKNYEPAANRNKKNSNCMLVLTEGLSAKSTAMVARSASKNKNDIGVFSLKGKVLNTNGKTDEKVKDNVELSNLCAILGLSDDHDYSKNSDFDKLKYKRVVLMCDQDNDGAHIRGLVAYYFHSKWPELLDRDFLYVQYSPLIKAKMKRGDVMCFYNEAQYKTWKEGVREKDIVSIKYYKGLGTATNAEAKSMLDEEDRYLLKYDKEAKDYTLELVFNKKKANERKDWLKEKPIDVDIKTSQEFPITDICNSEIKEYSLANITRSIPFYMDGLKPSQRKIIYTLLLNPREMKVSQAAGLVSKETQYHHGEESLVQAIVNLNQNYPGSNNINLLYPSGQFGTAAENGKDSAQPRYIFTSIAKVANLIFRKEDMAVLPEQFAEGEKIEPKFLLPIIPMLLVNGASGIGTGYSTDVFSFNPLDIINIMKTIIEAARDKKKTISYEPISYWYRGIDADLVSEGDDSFFCSKYKIVGNNEILVPQLPPGVAINEYCSKIISSLEVLNTPDNKKTKKMESTKVSSITDFITDMKCEGKGTVYANVKFTMKPQYMEVLDTKSMSYGKFLLLKNLGLASKRHAFTNANCIDNNYNVMLINNVFDFCKYFFNHRLDFYELRRNNIIETLQYQLNIAEAKYNFIKEVIDKKLVISKLSQQELVSHFEDEEYFKDNNGYDYLTNMRMSSMTTDRLERLLKDCKDKKAELNKIKKTTVYTMWLSDLEELEEFLLNYKILDGEEDTSKKSDISLYSTEYREYELASR